MDTRTVKAQEIVAGGRITEADGTFTVGSQSGAGTYRVSIEEPSCTCDDFSLRGRPCKHIIATLIWVTQGGCIAKEESAQPRQPAKRKTYSQDWKNYNLAQTNERRHFLALLADLCTTIKEPAAKPGPGRK